MSTLSAAALIEGVVESLLMREERETTMLCNEGTHMDEEAALDKAHKAAKDLVEDMKDVMGISQVSFYLPITWAFFLIWCLQTDLCECQHWLSLL